MSFKRIREHMEQAAKDIDAVFGDGYAKEHAELIAGYIQALALADQAERLGNMLQKDIVGKLERISSAIGALRD
jgi:predicted chitinase